MVKRQSEKTIQKSVSEKFIDQFYSIQAELYSENGEKLDVPESGFLGLLAIGYKGLAIHRKKRGYTHIYYKFTKGKKLIRRNPKLRQKTKTKN